MILIKKQPTVKEISKDDALTNPRESSIRVKARLVGIDGFVARHPRYILPSAIENCFLYVLTDLSIRSINNNFYGSKCT